jgi:hypothetical protein
MERNNPRYWLEKRARVRSGYPMATVIYYGPTADFASKVAVGIIRREKEAAELHKWHDPEVDVRHDSRVLNEVLDCLDEHQVKRIAMANRILGCPHEEGTDYPEGETCPQCPYWANRDRFTGKLLDEGA